MFQKHTQVVFRFLCMVWRNKNLNSEYIFRSASNQISTEQCRRQNPLFWGPRERRVNRTTLPLDGLFQHGLGSKRDRSRIHRARLPRADRNRVLDGLHVWDVLQGGERYVCQSGANSSLDFVLSRQTNGEAAQSNGSWKGKEHYDHVTIFFYQTGPFIGRLFNYQGVLESSEDLYSKVS